jgi:hypothetical protein
MAKVSAKGSVYAGDEGLCERVWGCVIAGGRGLCKRSIEVHDGRR